MKLKTDAFTLTEVLVASVVAVLLFGSVCGAFTTTKSIFVPGLEVANLQKDVSVILQKIIHGEKEGSDISGLRAASSFIIPVANPAGSEINFTNPVGQTRRYFLSGRSVIYANPALVPSQKTIYTAQPDSNITLRFWEPAGYVDHGTVGVYISVSRQTGGKTISGSLSTFVNLKNAPK